MLNSANRGKPDLAHTQRTPHRSHLAALLGYAVLTVGMTWPLALQAGAAIPGDGFDGWQNTWNLWWVKTALVERFANPFHTDMLFPPTGVDLYFHTLNFFNGLVSLPVQAVGGLLWAYNSVVLLSFVLGGYGVFLLVRYLAHRQGQRGPWVGWAAFVGGCVFTFSPFHFAHLLGHMQVFSLEWLPFYVLAFLKAMEQPPKGWRGALTPALFLILVGLCDWYYVFYLGLFTLLYLAYLGVQRRLGWAHLRTSVGIGLLFAVALSPLLAPMVRTASRESFMVPDPQQTVQLSADLLAFVTPNPFHPLWGSAARQAGERFGSTLSERTVFLGFTPLALALVGGWRCFRRGRFWWVSLAAFTVLALGPVLHVGGRSAWGTSGWQVPLPYMLLYHLVPFVQISRSVSRFSVMVMLSLAVLAGIGMLALAQGRRECWGWRAGLGAAAVALICFEFLPTPYPLSPPDTPAWYRQLAAEPGDFAILNVPMNWDRPGYLLYQTEHGKRLSVAYISRDDPSTLTERLGILQQFRHLGGDIIRQDPAAVAGTTFRHLGVRYLVADLYKMPGSEERAPTLALLEQIVGGEGAPVHQDERLLVYAAPLQTPPAPTLILGRGWGPLTQADGARPIEVEAGLSILAEEPAQVRLLAAGFAPQGCTLELVHGGRVVGRWEWGQAFSQGSSEPLTLQPGLTELLLRPAAGGGCFVSGLDLIAE
ncbi:MAG: hypothetical protein GX605_06545 [Chloroflexi bacterium]|nr:hypothetical protein [Chloroflexota bacterium]